MSSGTDRVGGREGEDPCEGGLKVRVLCWDGEGTGEGEGRRRKRG